MKRFLSWLLLLVGMVILDIVFGLMTRLAMLIVGLLSGLSTWLIVVIVLVAGSAFIGIVTLPAMYGTGFLVELCERVCPTKKGTRYYVAAGLWAAYVIYAVVAVIVAKGYWWLLIQAAMIAYAAVAMIVVGRHMVEENAKMERAAARRAEREKTHPPIEDLMPDRKRQIAADMAENGDFSGYLDLGYSEEEVRKARNKWLRENDPKSSEYKKVLSEAISMVRVTGNYRALRELGYSDKEIAEGFARIAQREQ